MGNRFKYISFFIIFLSLFSIGVSSQNYHAMHGSSYAGSIGVGNNPASIVNAPYAWDVNLFSTQLKYTTNAVTIYKYSLLSSAATSEYQFDSGYYKRYADFNFNTNLLNARLALDRRQSIAFGMNLRGYGITNTSDYNYIDTVKKVKDFFKLNNNTTVYQLDMLHTSWLEIFATYSRTIWDQETDRLNAGITIKAMRGISGAYASLENLRAMQVGAGNPPAYALATGNAAIGYSSNYDTWNRGKTANENLMNFVTHSEGGISVDIGIEYLVKTQAVTSFHDEESYFDYEWKFGFSLLDIGQNNYKHGTNSRTFNTVRPNISDASVQNKFSSIRSLKNFNDSLATLVNSSGSPGRMFTVINPARMVLNVDRYITGNIYINGELSLNLSPLAGNKNMYAKELNLLTITPRWETQRWGGYLPVTYNNRGKLWIGGAFKAGPVLFGIHNWGNVFSTKKMANGGGYLAFIIHAANVTGKDKIRNIDCPPGRLR